MDSGRLLVELRLAGGRIAGVAARSTRPAAAAVLVGKNPEQALALIPLLFSLCGRAQRAVAAAAIGAARGEAAADDAGLRLEAAQEHLWRVLLDWPAALGRPPRPAQFAHWHRRLAAVARRGAAAVTDLVGDLDGFLADQVFGQPLANWLDADDDDEASFVGQLLAALSVVETPHGAPLTPHLLPPLSAPAWAELLTKAPAGFVKQPTWQGAPAETGALARHAGQPRVATCLRAGQGWRARLLARLIDLALTPAQLAAPPARIDAASSAPGHGVAVADTARGQLVHMLRLEAGQVADYVVLAPTEWNFHPQGAWLSGLRGQPVADAGAAEALLRLHVLAGDPCIPFSTGVVDA